MNLKNKLISLVALFAGIISGFTALPNPVAADDVWFFASDVHEFGDSRLKPIFEEIMPGDYDVVALVGDYQKYFGSNTDSYDNILNIVNSYKSGSAMAILTQGNHDVYCGAHNCYTHPTGGVVPPTQYSTSYVINEKDFCDLNTMLLGQFILHQMYDPVVVVLGHYPLHSPRIDGACKTKAIEIFNTLQMMGSGSHRDIIYVWGHNHSNSSYDVGIDNTMLPGDVVPSLETIYDEIEGQTMNFIYMNAGYIKGIDLAEASWTRLSLDRDWIIIDRHGDDQEWLALPRDYN